MKSINFLFAGLGLVFAVSELGGISQAQAGGSCGGGWVSVGGGGCALPQDLSIGDRVLLSIGSAVNREGIILGYAYCNGQRTYYTSANQTGCGFSNAIAAYRRTNGNTSAEAQSTSGLKVPK